MGGGGGCRQPHHDVNERRAYRCRIPLLLREWRPSSQANRPVLTSDQKGCHRSETGRWDHHLSGSRRLKVAARRCLAAVLVLTIIAFAPGVARAGGPSWSGHALSWSTPQALLRGVACPGVHVCVAVGGSLLRDKTTIEPLVETGF